MLLCFIMGLQNAMITKPSNAEIRTTHLTGMVTDIGIELGKLCYWNAAAPARTPSSTQARPLPRVLADRCKLRLLVVLVTLFFAGGVAGALGFKHLGFSATLPLAVLLLALIAVPLTDDLRSRWRTGSLPRLAARTRQRVQAGALHRRR
jgi:uncharacterized membrane protein YoaK (UPF0700 family)